ncbi:MAG: hypothetical protein IJM59_09620 [Proteobacteria bacterium]|nr:hypothetical protein [Pseudomonadota bacterium]
MKRIVLSIFVLLVCLLPQIAFAEADNVQCTESNKRIFCNLMIPQFIQKISPVLTNGWENSIQIKISLLSSDGEKTLLRSHLEATQRCYLDPFESPCLILWRGASMWQRYRDENAFLSALSQIGIQALTLTDLPPDNYIIRVTIQLMPSARKRMNYIQSWFKSTNGDSGSGSWSTGSIISSVLSSRAESVEEETYSVTLDTNQFYIDITFNPESEANSEETANTDESSESSESSESDENNTQSQTETQESAE